MPSGPPGAGVRDSRVGGDGARLIDVVRPMVPGMSRPVPGHAEGGPASSITGNGTRGGAGARGTPGLFTLLRSPAREAGNDQAFPALATWSPVPDAGAGQSQSLRLNVRYSTADRTTMTAAEVMNPDSRPNPG